MRTIVLTVPADAAELASDRLWAAGARAVEERSIAGGTVELRTALGDDDDEARRRLGATPDDWHVEFVDVDEVGLETWREFAVPVVVHGGLVIAPAWLPAADRPGVVTVRIEPGGAFGLGDHPTTRLSAAATDQCVRSGDRVLDVGCGSGVLGILAAVRGAATVVAIDIAETAREATVANADLNGVADVIDASTSAVDAITGSFDLVVANILAPTLVAMASDLRRLTAPTGRLVVSGVLTGGYDHVVRALQPMYVVGVSDLDGWSAVTLAHEER